MRESENGTIGAREKDRGPKRGVKTVRFAQTSLIWVRALEGMVKGDPTCRKEAYSMGWVEAKSGG